MNNRPKVGVAVILIKNNHILLGKRKNSHGEGTWNCPGGHLEFGESLEECARREVLEETGLNINSPQFFAITNDIFEKEQKHYITIFMKIEINDGEPKIMEPEKCEAWQWFEWEKLPTPLFLPLQNHIKKNHNI